MIILSDRQDKSSLYRNATLLKKQQDAHAAALKEMQDMLAISIENKKTPACAVEVERLKKATENALKSAQKKAALNLKIANADNAKAVKKMHEFFVEQISEKDSVITWLAGGYSVTINKN